MSELFLEPVRAPEFDDGDTGFELPPDPHVQVSGSPFRPDWERARWQFERGDGSW